MRDEMNRLNLDRRRQIIGAFFARPTNGFSKKIENMTAAVSLHFAHYNFVRQHKACV